MRLYLARHGESEGNVKRLFYGVTDLALTERGRAQARELGEKLAGIHIDRCFVSPLSRADETARLALAGRDVPIVTRRELIEQDMGDFENKGYEQLLAEYPGLVQGMLADWSLFPPPGGESFEQVSARTRSLLDEVLAENEDTLLVGHNGALATLIIQLLDMQPRAVTHIWMLHGCYTSVDISHGFVRLEYFNK